MALRLPPTKLRGVFQRLLADHGPQHWWPGNSPFEVMVGAVLTQNTAWINVERAIANLVANNALSPHAIEAADATQLAEWLRPSGYFNIKAKRLRSFCVWYLQSGGYDVLKDVPTVPLRNTLLAVHGIGPETADDILLYAFERPVFVVDAYTRRLFARLGYIEGDEPYDRIRLAFEQALGEDVVLFNEYHALIVAHAKDICRVKPRCSACGLNSTCPAARKGIL